MRSQDLVRIEEDTTIERAGALIDNGQLSTHRLRQNAGINQMAMVVDLKNLSLHSTTVNEECISDLVKWQQLAVLNVSRTEMTEDGIACLAKALPHCEIKPVD